MKFLAFVPARGGSKGIPRKNLVPLGGKPLILHTLEAARGSSFVDYIFVSTDDDEIASVCENVGVPVPYRRPQAFATDEAAMIDSVLDGVSWLEAHGQNFDALVLLQPTSPLRTAGDIDEACRMFLAEEAETLVGVHQMGEHPYECVRRTGEGWQLLARPERQAFRRQDYGEDFYFINGALYIASLSWLQRERSFFAEGRTTLYAMEPTHGVDIDDLRGIAVAETYLRLREERSK